MKQNVRLFSRMSRRCTASWASCNVNRGGGRAALLFSNEQLLIVDDGWLRKVKKNVPRLLSHLRKTVYSFHATLESMTSPISSPHTRDSVTSLEASVYVDLWRREGQGTKTRTRVHVGCSPCQPQWFIAALVHCLQCVTLSVCVCITTAQVHGQIIFWIIIADWPVLPL